MHMHSDDRMTQWGVLRGAIRMEWDDIPDEDLAEIDNDKNRLITCLRHRYGYTHMQAVAEIDRFARDQGFTL